MKEPKEISIQQIVDDGAFLNILEVGKDIPFVVRRLYFLHGVKNGAIRGGHAHRKLQQVVIAMSGSFQITLDSANGRFDFALDSPNSGVLVPPMCWRTLSNFSEGAVCLVLASEFFTESDYIRDYPSFLAQIVDSAAQ